MYTQEIDLRANTTVTAEVKAQMDNSPVVSPVYERMGIVNDLQSIPEALNNSTDSYKENTAIIKEFGDALPEIIKNLRMMNDAVVRNTQNLPAIKKTFTDEEKKKQRYDELTRQNILGVFNSGSNIVQSYANGNTTGAVLSGVNGVTNMANNFSKAAEMDEMGNLAKGLLVTVVVGAIAGAVIKGADALSNKFIDEMPSIYGTGRAFGSTDDKFSLTAWSKLNDYNKGTALDIETFQNLAQSLRKQGMGNNLITPEAQMQLIGNVAQTTSRWAYATGGDANQYAQLAGIMSRYGGSKNVAEDFNYLVSAGKASGLNDTQIPEFLSGIQKVMEDGIANGFSRSATEVASTLLMFSKLSNNNPFWQGEQGAKLLNQANRGLAGATSLSKTSDIIAYQAISKAYKDKEESVLGEDLYLKDGGYVNKMMLLEKGLNKDNFSAIMNSVTSTTSDKQHQIEILRDMFGVNYTGASRLMNLYDKNGGKVSDIDIKNILKAPENQNNETKNQENINTIKEVIVKIGSKVAALKIEGIGVVVDGVTRLANKLAPEESLVLPSDNTFEESMRKRNGLDEDYEENKAKTLEKAVTELSPGQLALFNSFSTDIYPYANGRGWERAFNAANSLNPLNEDFDSPAIYKTENAKSSEFPFWVTKLNKKEYIQNNPYKTTRVLTDKDTVGGMLTISNKYNELVSRGKIKGTELLDAMAKDEELNKAFTKAAKDKTFSSKEISSLETILENIYLQLISGINVNESN